LRCDATDSEKDQDGQTREFPIHSVWENQTQLETSFAQVPIDPGELHWPGELIEGRLQES